MTDFTLPETIDYRAFYASASTRKLPDGTFEAVAAFWFGGKRQNMKTAVGATRARARSAALLAIGCARA